MKNKIILMIGVIITVLMVIPMMVKATVETHNLKFINADSIQNTNWMQYESGDEIQGRFLLYKIENNNPVVITPGNVESEQDPNNEEETRNYVAINGLDNGEYYIAVDPEEYMEVAEIKLDGVNIDFDSSMIYDAGNGHTYTSYPINLTNSMSENLEVFAGIYYEDREVYIPGRVEFPSVTEIDPFDDTIAYVKKNNNTLATLKVKNLFNNGYMHFEQEDGHEIYFMFDANQYQVEITKEEGFDVYYNSFTKGTIAGQTLGTSAPITFTENQGVEQLGVDDLDTSFGYKYDIKLRTQRSESSIVFNNIEHVTNECLGEIASGQNIAGTIKLEKDGSLIPISNLTELGEYHFTNLESGEYKVTISPYEGYAVNYLEYDFKENSGSSSINDNKVYPGEESGCILNDDGSCTYTFTLNTGNIYGFSASVFENQNPGPNPPPGSQIIAGRINLNSIHELTNDNKTGNIFDSEGNLKGTISFKNGEEVVVINGNSDDGFYIDSNSNYTVNITESDDYELDRVSIMNPDYFNEYLEEDGLSYDLDELDSNSGYIMDFYFSYKKVANSLTLTHLRNSENNLGIYSEFNYDNGEEVEVGTIKLEKLVGNIPTQIPINNLEGGEFQLKDVVASDYRVTIDYIDNYEIDYLLFYKNNNEQIINEDSNDLALDPLERQAVYDFTFENEDAIWLRPEFQEEEPPFEIKINNVVVFNEETSTYDEDFDGEVVASNPGNYEIVRKINNNNDDDVRYEIIMEENGNIGYIETNMATTLGIVPKGNNTIATNPSTGLSIAMNGADFGKQLGIISDSQYEGENVLSLEGGILTRTLNLDGENITLNIGSEEARSFVGFQNINEINAKIEEINIFTNDIAIKDCNDILIEGKCVLNIDSGTSPAVTHEFNYDDVYFTNITVRTGGKLNILNSGSNGDFNKYVSYIDSENDNDFTTELLTTLGTDDIKKYHFAANAEDNWMELWSTSGNLYILNDNYDNIINGHGEAYIISFNGFQNEEYNNGNAYEFFIEENTKVDLVIWPNYGYQIKNNSFKINGELVDLTMNEEYFPDNVVYSFTMPSENAIIDVEFEEIDENEKILKEETSSKIRGFDFEVDVDELESDAIGQVTIDITDTPLVNPNRFRALVTPGSTIQNYFDLDVNVNLKLYNSNNYVHKKQFDGTDVTYKLYLDDSLKGKGSYKIIQENSEDEMVIIDATYNVSENSITFTSNSYRPFALVTTEVIAPAAPSVWRTWYNYNTISIAWNRVADETGYYIYRSTGGAYSYVGKTSSNIYTDYNLNTGWNYYYKVKAYKIVNGTERVSDFSNYVYTKPYLAKTSIKLYKSGSSKIKIKYSGVSGAYKYQIYRKTAGSKWKRIKTLSSTQTSYKNKVSRGTKYYYKVRSYRYVAGKKVYSAYSSTKNKRI